MRKEYKNQCRRVQLTCRVPGSSTSIFHCFLTQIPHQQISTLTGQCQFRSTNTQFCSLRTSNLHCQKRIIARQRIYQRLKMAPISITAFSLIFISTLSIFSLAHCKTLKRDGINLRSFFAVIYFYLAQKISTFFFLNVFDRIINGFFFFPLQFAVKALNEIKASLGWRVVYAWVGDDPCGDGDLPPWSGVTCSTVGDYRVVTEL